MSETVLEQSLQIILQETTAAAVVAVLLAAGLVGMSIRTVVESVVTSDERPETGEPISDGGAVTASEDSAASGGESRTADRQTDDDDESEELEHRLDELEHEVDSLSSTVNTVRNENEQIADSVQDIEENTGRLLNLYQMATRGVNPFDSGDSSSENTAQKADSESSHSPEDEIERIDTGTASEGDATFDSGTTDALSSDAGVREQHCVDSVEEVVETETEPEDVFQKRKQQTDAAADKNGKPVDGVEEISEDATEDEFTDEESEETFGKEEMIETAADNSATAASDGGMLIEESDSEANDVRTPDAETSSPDVAKEVHQQEAETAETTRSSVQKLDARLDPKPETQPEPQARSEAELGVEQEPVAAPEPTETTAPAVTPASSSEGKPYIESLPEGFTAEVLAVEWLEYLIEEVGLAKAISAIHYYETIGWITEETAAELDGYLSGFDTAESGALSIEHHLRSLDYVEELTATAEMSELTGEKL